MQLSSVIKNHSPLAPHLLDELNTTIDALLEKVQKQPQDLFPVDTSADNKILIWSDGACSGNPGPGGWGTIVEMAGRRFEFSGSSRRTTNNIMELTGALVGIKQTPEGSSIVLTSDSQYLIKGMTEWLANWKKKGWKKADGAPVLNKELWLELDAESQKRSIRWQWIKGHASHPENERCDKLAREAIMH